MIRILVADDHPIIRKGVINIVSSEPDMVVAHETASGRAVIELIMNKDVDIVILDILMPEMNGFEILSKLKVLLPELPVLMLSAGSEQVFTSKSLRSGASGFINKETAHEELVPAIRKIMAGGIYISEPLREIIASDPDHNVVKPLHSLLSKREFQILTMIGAGKSTTEISYKLQLNVKTISTFRSRILHKMGMKNNNDIIRYCLNEGLIK